MPGPTRCLPILPPSRSSCSRSRGGRTRPPSCFLPRAGARAPGGAAPVGRHCRSRPAAAIARGGRRVVKRLAANPRHHPPHRALAGCEARNRPPCKKARAAPLPAAPRRGTNREGRVSCSLPILSTIRPRPCCFAWRGVADLPDLPAWRGWCRWRNSSRRPRGGRNRPKRPVCQRMLIGRISTRQRNLMVRNARKRASRIMLSRRAASFETHRCLLTMRVVRRRVAPPTEPDQERAGKLVRPLLDIPKARLISTLDEAGIAYAADPSNHDPRFARTRWRRILPALAVEGLTARRLGAVGAAGAAQRSGP